MKTRSNIIKARIIRGPKIMSTLPAHGAVGVDPNATIFIQFNKPVQLANFALERVSTHALQGRTVTHPGGNLTQILITPTLAMAAGEDYRIYERIGFPIIDYVNKERIPYGATFPFTFTIA